MEVADLQLQLHKAIDQVTDSKKLEAIYALLKDAKGPFTPMSKKEYIDAINTSKQQIVEGNYSSVEDFEKESKNWQIRKR